MKRLENKVAVVYGDGSTGGAIAKAFAQEGAKVFLTGGLFAAKLRQYRRLRLLTKCSKFMENHII